MIPSYRKRFVTLGLIALGLLLPWVASAAYIDLTYEGATGTVNGAYFFQYDEQPAGSGVIESFVRIQDATPDGGFTDGVNTSDRPVLNDEKNGGSPFTRDLLLADVGFAYHEGQWYREFFLDINEANGPGDESLLSLDRIKIYVTDNIDTTIADFNDDPADNGPFSVAPIFDLDMGGDNAILLDYALDRGSGEADMRMLVLNDLFVGGDYVYLYSAFGELGDDTDIPGFSIHNWENSSGYEEWYHGTAPIPEPSTYLLLGSGLVALFFYRRRFNK